MAKHLKKRKNKTPTPEYRENYDRIFEKKKDLHPFRILGEADAIDILHRRYR